MGQKTRTGSTPSAARLARTNHSSEGQAYEALYNLIRYEKDVELLAIYRRWVSELWERNWMEGNSLFTYMTLALLPEYRPVTIPGTPRSVSAEAAEESLLPAGLALLAVAKKAQLATFEDKLRRNYGCKI